MAEESVRTSRRAFLKQTTAAALAAGANARAIASQLNGKKIYPDRWVFVMHPIDSDRRVEEVREIAHTASEHGLTAMVLNGMDALTLVDGASLDRLRKVKAIADEYHLELIPSGFGVGRGGALLGHDMNLAEGLLVQDALFVAKDGEAHFVSDSPAKLQNGDFSKFDGHRFDGFNVQDEPGHKTFVDTAVSHSGKASLRIEYSGLAWHDEQVAAQELGLAPFLDQASQFIPGTTARAAQKIRVTPNRCYRVSAWVKTEDVEPLSLFSIKAFTPDGRDLCPFEPSAPKPTSNWRKVTTAFNSWYADAVELNFGVFEGVKGKVWVDDIELEEVGLMNIIRRKGAPLTVRDEATGKVYEEGRDFAPVADPDLDFLWTHEMPSIRLLPRGRIKDGARLRVSYYHGTTIYDGQVGACPSEPETQEIWKQQFPLIEKYLAPKCYLLGVDEVRVLNRCEACRSRKLDAAAMLGQMTSWFYDQVRAVNPTAEVLCWSDMFDAGHNARRMYFLVDGSLEDTWKYLPKDMGIVAWYFEERHESLEFFSSHGFKTIAAAYYDGDDLTNPEGWLEELDATPHAAGIMYTTWADKYKLLGPFGDLVSKR